MNVEKNQVYEVDILDNGIEGEGIAKIDGFTVFVPGTIKGEKVRVKILKVLSSHGFGKVEEIIEKSEFRRDADCDTFSKCGGCSMRHMSYEKTLEVKRNNVISTLKKQGLDIEVKDVIGMDKPFFYRNKLQYPVGMDSNGNAVLGIFAPRSHRIIETKKCFIQDERLQDIANSIFKFIRENNIPVYDEKNFTGEIRHLVLRIGVKTGEIVVTIVSNNEKITKEKELIEFVVRKYPNVKTIIKNVNSKNTNVILGNENVVLYGEGYIYDELLGFKFKISPMSFYQVNPYQTEKLYSKAIEYADLSGKETVFDLYCGIGTIGICASRNVKKLYGIETVPDAIKDAKENARINGIRNAEFFVGDVEKTLPKFIEENDIRPDVVFLDPPRKGCEKTALDTLMKIMPKKIVYVSCNPATLARDLKILQDRYKTKEVTPVDMFPYTSHVECCSVLSLKDSIQ